MKIRREKEGKSIIFKIQKWRINSSFIFKYTLYNKIMSAKEFKPQIKEKSYDDEDESNENNRKSF